jgi:hypothetical protein
MIVLNISSLRSAISKIAMIALGCTLGLAVVPLPSARAADAAPSLPLTATFEKSMDQEGGLYVLNLKNVSSDTLKVTTKVLLSVAFHADSKARNIPEHAIDPGQVWTIPNLAAADKVIITAKDFAPLELTVP